MVDAEYKVLFDQCQAVKDAGANIVLSKLPIGDVATQWFADQVWSLTTRLHFVSLSLCKSKLHGLAERNGTE